MDRRQSKPGRNIIILVGFYSDYREEFERVPTMGLHKVACCDHSYGDN